MRYILSNPKAGLIFIIPSLEETLHIIGNACIIRDEELLKPMEVNAKNPVLGIGVKVKALQDSYSSRLY